MTIDSFQGTYRFLSNFWPASVEFEGMKYPSVEHAYQAAKTFDIILRDKIRHTPSPGATKRLAHTFELRPDWEDIKLMVMLDLLRQKFQHLALQELLLDTENQELVEGNTWGDTFWGVCGERGGYNHLGNLLMQVRKEIQRGLI